MAAEELTRAVWDIDADVSRREQGGDGHRQDGEEDDRRDDDAEVDEVGHHRLRPRLSDEGRRGAGE